MSSPARQPIAPYSEDAEAALLGAALVFPSAQEVLRALSPQDFYVERHRHVAAAIHGLWAEGAWADPTLVAVWLDRHHRLAEAGGVENINHLQVIGGVSSAAPTYAATVREMALRRRLLAFAGELTHSARDKAIPIGTVLTLVEDGYRSLASPLEGEGPDLDAGEFITQSADYDWIVPNLIERGDRLILTGEEGANAGKSTFFLQLAVQMAAGIHPWSLTRVPPVNVLLLDMENSPAQITRRLRPLLFRAGYSEQARMIDDGAGIDVGRLRIRCHPSGVDLLRPDDQRWFRSRIAANEPDVVITGPIYKLHSGNATDEEPAAQVARFLDDVRTRYRFALMLEAHSPKSSDETGARTVRPYGASLWMRWPEFGLGLRPAGREEPGVWLLVNWKSRDNEREWPYRIRRGGQWPWSTVQLQMPVEPEF